MYIPQVSIVVPVYNVEKYLPECIESILVQTFVNFELLLIDDGTPDQSGIICDEYAKKDSRIRVFHKQNGGVSSARNLGLREAKGEWVVFVDSDDWVESNYISSMFRYTCDFDFVLAGWHTFSHSNIQMSGVKFMDENYIGNEISKLFSKHQIYRFGGPISKMYKLSLIRQNCYSFNEKINYAEDLLFMLQYIQSVSSIKLIGDQSYFYRVNYGDTLSSKSNSFKVEFYVLNQLKIQFGKLSKKFKFSDFETKSIKVFLIDYLVRVSNSLYNSESRIKRNKIQLLKRVVGQNKDLIQFFDFYNSYCTDQKIVVFLLKNNLFSIFDLYRSCLFPIIKKIKNRLL